MHIPVLLEEVIDGLHVKKNGIYVDGTVGYGGHTEEIAKRQKCSLQIIGIDKDQEALDSASNRLKKYKSIELVKGSYNQLPELLKDSSIDLVDGVLLDLGASSPQFDDPKRGFSFSKDGPLDMRFDIGSHKTAADILNTYPEKDLARIIKDYGEERFAKRIAGAIVKQRREEKFARTSQLVELIETTLPRKAWPKNIHPATRTFQALRIEVNSELDELREALIKIVYMLKPGGRLVVISFHSLEDRIVKQFFKEGEKECVCPKAFPVCRCDKEKLLKIINKKPITASKTEIKNNVRSRSAKLRIAERL